MSIKTNVFLFCFYCRVQYATGEEETLDLAEVIRENQMNLLL
jgi:hypothetical protein